MSIVKFLAVPGFGVAGVVLAGTLIRIGELFSRCNAGPEGYGMAMAMLGIIGLATGALIATKDLQ